MDNEKNPWKIMNETKVYDNPWISLTHFNVINPGGGEGIYGKIHFKNLAIGIIPLDKEGNTWLVGQFRFTLNAYSWEIPAGGGPLDHDALISAQRELQEETGLKAAKWEEILHMHLSNSVTDEYCIVFLARDLTQVEADPEETKELSVKKISLEEAYQKVVSGEITDSVTVAAVLRLKTMLLEGKIKI